jgi:hypothetical protein
MQGGGGMMNVVAILSQQKEREKEREKEGKKPE